MAGEDSQSAPSEQMVLKRRRRRFWQCVLPEIERSEVARASSSRPVGMSPSKSPAAKERLSFQLCPLPRVTVVLPTRVRERWTV